ncbi:MULTISPECIES: hypothetical protein [Cupriavidus]|jgi:hypothetical protein|uniref:hypothetical protein n=1 Tax=Cupriavidus sp. DF5525 TaxID=3160989 RepID=UPI0003B0D128|nr:hypothetical protein N234_34205 [Ralstonia pickettii DTP0602]
MTALVEWTREHTCRLFPMSAEYSPGGGSQVYISWQAEPEGSPGRCRMSAALQFDQSVIDAVYLADATELDRIGARLARLVSRWLADDDIACLAGTALVIPVGEVLLSH